MRRLRVSDATGSARVRAAIDSDAIVVGRGDNLLAFPLDATVLRTRLCELAGRSMTPAEIDYYLGRLAATGYGGWIGLEYKPSGKSADSFGWLPPERRSAAG